MGEIEGGLDTGEMAYVVLDSLADAAYVLDREWRIIFVNQAFVRHMDRPRTDLLGTPLWDVIAPASHPHLRENFSRVRDQGVADSFVQESVVRPGLTMDVRVFPVFDGLAVISRDISRRIKNERALAISEAHLRLALDGAAMGTGRGTPRPTR